jgi:hypothetical protein
MLTINWKLLVKPVAIGANLVTIFLDPLFNRICQVVRSWLRAGIISNKGAIELVSLVRKTDEGAENLRSSDDNISEAMSAWLLEKPSELLEEEKYGNRLIMGFTIA